MFKKSILVLIVAVLAVLAYGTLSTGAWFTDQEDVATGTVSAGTLDLKVTTDGDFLVENLEPGDPEFTNIGVFCAENIGDFDMKWQGDISITAGNEALAEYLLVQVIMNPTGYVGNYGPEGKDLLTEDFGEVTLQELIDKDPPILMDDPQWAFAPGHKACYALNVKLDASAPNTMKNQWLQAKLVLNATQDLNPGWTE
ncbi:MAG TPA: TasA family protein [Anaerolineaceae bacterium]|nr:TasA family protein [Anaerolineaceae bacterium]